MKTLCIPILLSPLLVVSNSSAAIVLTEVDFATDTIELTNVGDTNCSGSLLEVCVPFLYRTLEPATFTFTPGETRTYPITINVDAAAGDDLWIYKDKSVNFGEVDKVITGAVYGPTLPGGGRISAVVGGSPGPAWVSTSEFVNTGSVGPGQTMQLAPGSPSANTSASWIIADANLGSYAAVAELTLFIKPGPGAGQVIVFWPTSTPGTAVLQSNTVLSTNGWSAVAGTPSTNGPNLELELPAVGTEFFRLAN